MLLRQLFHEHHSLVVIFTYVRVYIGSYRYGYYI